MRLFASERFASLAAAFALTSFASLTALTGCSGASDPSIGADPTATADTDAGAGTTPVVPNADAGSASSGDDDAASNGDDDGAAPGTGAKDYSATQAVTYAAAHWDDGVGECAEFVSHCLRAGHLDIPVITWVPSLLDELNTLGLTYEEHGESGSASASVGDVVIFSDASGAKFCDDHSSDEGNCGHTCIVTVAGDSASTIEVDCHNNAHHKMAVKDFFGSEFSRYRVYHLAD